MTDDNQEPVYEENPELISVRRLSTFQRPKSGIDNLALDLYERSVSTDGNIVVINVEEGDGRADSVLSTPASVRIPLTENKTNLAKEMEQLHGIKEAVSRVSSYAGRRPSIKASKKSSLPTSSDFTRSWQGIESYLREQEQKEDSDSLDGGGPNKKAFYQRTWFSCTFYCLLLLMLLAAVLAIAVHRAIILPNTLIDGEILTTPAPAGPMIPAATYRFKALLRPDTPTTTASSSTTYYSYNTQQTDTTVQPDPITSTPVQSDTTVSSKDETTVTPTTADVTTASSEDETTTATPTTAVVTRVSSEDETTTVTPTTESVTTVTSTADETTVEQLEDDTTVPPEVFDLVDDATEPVTTTTLPDTTFDPSEVELQRELLSNWLVLLSMPGPLQRFPSPPNDI